MGNSEGKPSVKSVDKEFLAQNTAVSMDEIVKYDNFLLEHPDGQITPKDFR